MVFFPTKQKADREPRQRYAHHLIIKIQPQPFFEFFECWILGDHILVFVLARVELFGCFGFLYFSVDAQEGVSQLLSKKLHRIIFKPLQNGGLQGIAQPNQGIVRWAFLHDPPKHH